MALAPARERRLGSGEDALDLVRRGLGEALEDLAGLGVDGLDAHFDRPRDLLIAIREFLI